MTSSQFILSLCLGLLVLRWLAATALSNLNKRHVQAHADRIPREFEGIMDPPTYARSVEYTLAKARFGSFEDSVSTAILIAVLCLGFLPWSQSIWTQSFGSGAWAGAGWLSAVGLILSLPDLPFSWWSQFRLEDRFGFNQGTPRLWILDRIKMLTLALLIATPLLALILHLTRRIGPLWWLWAWALLIGFQLLMMIVAPIFILPLFNKFSPLPDGSLRARLIRLGQRTGFTAKTIQVVDGSKRSSHSNAYFTGFGRFRKIVLFDTLISQLTESELEAVLAHEIGHYKRGHLPRMLAWSTLSLLASFALIGWLAERPELLLAFGFQANAGFAPVLLLFGLLSGAFTFWLSPLTHFWSRKHEYEADAYAVAAVGGPSALSGALRKLHEKNLSNLTPHPLFSAFHYSHPTLVERERSMNRGFSASTSTLPPT